ncbi:hypothetical protein FDK38_004952 [Candidozyma auris]|nr:hypothetical protein FDK38_004952 [[Candida] auris]
MPTIVVFHNSSLVGCLVAAALRLHFTARHLKIIVVEALETSLTRQPYCGISTISNGKLHHREFMQRALLQGVLARSVTYLDSIHISECSASRHPEFPNAQHIFRARVGSPNQFFALVYHPQELLRSLRSSLLQDPSVTFLSVVDPSSVGAIQADCYIIFTPGENNNKRDNLDMAAHSSLCSVELVQSHRRAQMPPMLWLPSFKAATQMFDAIFTSAISPTSKGVNVDIHAINLNIDENKFASRYDLNHGLKACDYVLQLVDSLATSLGLVSVHL